MAVVPVEQHGELVPEFAPRSIVMDRGRIVDDGPSTTLAADPERLHDVVGVARRGRFPILDLHGTGAPKRSRPGSSGAAKVEDGKTVLVAA